MNNDMEVILIALMTAFVWGTTIFLVLVRHFDNQQTILRYNFWITFLMVVNIMVCLPALFLVNQQELKLVRQPGLATIIWYRHAHNGWLSYFHSDFMVMALPTVTSKFWFFSRVRDRIE